MSYVIDLLMFMVTITSMVGIFSILWKENPYYRAVQYLYVVQSAATFTLAGIAALSKNTFGPLLAGEYLLIIPLMLGLLVFLSYFESTQWIARFPLNFALGVGLALTIRGIIPTNIVGQIGGLLSYARIGGTPFETFTNIIQVGIAICVFSYFLFYFAHKWTIMRYTAKIGRYAILFWFGVSFGSTVMMNMTFIAYSTIYGLFLAPPVENKLITLGATGILLAIIVFGANYLSKRSSET